MIDYPNLGFSLIKVIKQKSVALTQGQKVKVHNRIHQHQ